MDNEYILTQILSYINTGVDYKAACLVCKRWFGIVSILFDRGDVFADHLMTLLTLYPDADWNYDKLSENPKLKMWYVMEHSTKPWNMYAIETHPNYTMEYIRKSTLKNRTILNKNITPEFVMEHADFSWNMYGTTIHPNVTLDFIKKNPEFPYYKERLWQNPNITWQDIVDNPDYFPDPSSYRFKNECTWEEFCMINDKYSKSVVFCDIAKHPSVTTDVIINDPRFDPLLLLHAFHKNPNFDFSIVLLFPSDWDWVVLSKHPKVTWDIIVSNPKLPWIPDAVSRNPNINIQIVRDNPTFGWNYGLLCANPGVVHGPNRMAILHELCDYNVFSRLPNYYLNPNFSWRDLEQTTITTNFSLLSQNTFNRMQKN